MASPAANNSASRFVDPRKSGKCTIKLGKSLMDSAKPSSKLSSVRFNHKPRQSASKRTAILRAPVQDHGDCTLTLEDKEEGQSEKRKFSYAGYKTSDRTSFVLVLDSTRQTATLEALDSEYNLNLQSTPDEPSATKLASQYPQAKKAGSGPDGASEESSNDERADSDNDLDAMDESNPFDFRHFLDSDGFGSQSSSPTDSTEGTPLLGPQKLSPQPRRAPSPAAGRKPLPKPAPQPLKQPPRPQIQRKRQSAPTTRAADVPQVRLDRRASTRETVTHSKANARGTSAQSSDEEDADNSYDGLIIDFGDSPGPSRKMRDFAFQLPDDNPGPISLRSAANSASPSSRLHTPARRVTSEDEEVIDLPDRFSGSDEEDASGPPESLYTDEQERVHDVRPSSAGSQNSDSDIDPLSLPSPAQRVRSSHAETSQLDVDGDDGVADLEAEMLQGLASQEEEELREMEVAGTHMVEESESESEAE